MKLIGADQKIARQKQCEYEVFLFGNGHAKNAGAMDRSLPPGIRKQ